MSWQTETGNAPEQPARRGARPGPERDLTIAEVRSRAGVSARTLRYYEEVGLLPGVRRRAGGRRVYGPDELERLHFISRLKTLGLSLAEIKELNAVYAIAGSTRAMLGRLDELLARHRADVEARIAELVALRGEIDAYRARVGHRIGRAPSSGTRRRRSA
ncbi:MAG TPA: MerR family transcriptional regulator [Myxococcota bacterium]|nr:MerR family transcriptional regulator [Myxococcota bacterium]